MKTILTISFLILSVIIFAQGSSKSKVGDFYLEYTSFNKTIIMKGEVITLLEWEEQYDNPISSMPGSRKEIIKTSVISSDDLSALKNLIKENRFMSLPKNEYGGSAEERYYPYSITVTTNGKQKKVLYRSNPSPGTEQAPQAFTNLEKKIDEIIVGIKQWSKN
jgi:hypothetical protein